MIMLKVAFFGTQLTIFSFLDTDSSQTTYSKIHQSPTTCNNIQYYTWCYIWEVNIYVTARCRGQAHSLVLNNTN